MSRFISKIFVIEDDAIFGRLIQKSLEKEQNNDVTVFQSGEDFFARLHENPDIVTIDYNLPGISGLEILKRIRNYNKNIKTVILSGQQNVEVVVEAYSNGANAYIVKNENALVELENTVRNLGKNVNLEKEVETLRDQVIDRNKYYNIIGESPAVYKLLRLIQKVENSDVLVLITGDSGTGKELVAQALHFNSHRRRRPFVAVNMAAIPEDLLEAELFGYEKGAFTGANNRKLGKFEEANEGSVFLDEVGELDMTMQTKLLRVLQEKKITRLGSSKETQLDIRIIAATNKNLRKLVDEGKFREDLYYRLQGFLIELPALRERGNDIIILGKNFLQKFCNDARISQKTLSPSAIERMLEHTWPGNVRELKAFVERAALISDTDVITADDLVFSR